MLAEASPNGLGGVGYTADDLEALTDGAIVQKRLVDNALKPIDRTAMVELFRGGLAYW